MNFEQFWSIVNSHSSPVIRKNLQEHGAQLLQALLLETFKHESVDIGIYLDPDNPKALLTYDPWNSDKQLSLRLDKNGKFDLYFECHEEDDYQSAIYELTNDDVLMIPQGLKALMEKVVRTEQPLGANRHTLQ